MGTDSRAGTLERYPFDAGTLPPAGRIYAVAMPAGVFGAAKVLATRTPFDQGLPEDMKRFAVFAVVTRFLDASPPTTGDPRLREFLFGPRGRVRGIWVGYVPPSNFKAAGEMLVTENEQALVGPYYSAWEYVVGTIRRELLRDNEPAIPQTG